MKRASSSGGSGGKKGSGAGGGREFEQGGQGSALYSAAEQVQQHDRVTVVVQVQIKSGQALLFVGCFCGLDVASVKSNMIWFEPSSRPSSRRPVLSPLRNS